MIMKKNRYPALLLCGILLMSAVSCGGESVSTENETVRETDAPETIAAVETDRSQIKDSLPEKDYNGTDFSILYRNEWAYEFVAEEQNGEVINDAVFARNLSVEERFHIVLDLFGLPGSYDSKDFMNAITNTVLAGDSEYDLIMGYQANMITPAMEGYYLNVYEIPYIEESAPWWSEKCNESITVNDKLYMTTGDIALTLWNGMYVYYFNKKLAEEYDIPDVYELVRGGKWTIDKLMELSGNVSADLNGDSVFNENDLYGFVTSEVNHMRAYLVSCQTPITRLNEDGFVEACLNTERTQETLDKLLALHYRASTFRKNSALNEPKNEQEPVIFTSDRALFMSGYLYNAQMLRNMDSDFGIIPYPKLDETQEEYATTSHNSLSMCCFPVTIRDPEMSGIITEALCAESYRNVVPKFYELSLIAKGARDEESGEMIDLIRESLTFDFGWVHSVPMGSIGTIYQDLINSNSPNFASSWASKESTVLSGLKKINDAYAAD